MDIAIEMGTSMTSIYLSGNGIVLREPTVVAFYGADGDKKLRSVGAKALEMLGKTPDNLTIVAPVVDGYVEDADVCVVLMTELIRKILPEYVFFPRIRAVVAVPTGLSVEERKVYEEIMLKAGVAEVTLLDDVMMTAVGFDLPVTAAFGGFVVNIGGGSTEIAAVSLAGIISGCAVSIGGNMMDQAIIDFIAGKYGLKIGLNTARKIKHEIGSLYANDISAMEIKGVNVRTLSPASLTVYATDVLEAVKPYYDQIAEAVANIANVCPPEVASDIHAAGVFVCGGGSKIPGLDKLFAARLNFPVTIADDGEYTAITGGGKLLCNKNLLLALL